MFIRSFAPEPVLGYLIMPSNIVRNGKSVPAGAVSSNNMMLPAGFVAQHPGTILSTELTCGGTARPFASILNSDQWRDGRLALKHNVFKRLAPHEPIEIGSHRAPASFGCRLA
jgi:hypothetical protein